MHRLPGIGSTTRRFLLSLLLVQFVALTTAGTVLAATIVFEFQAQITSGSDAGGLLAPVGGLNIGSTISGFYVLEDTTLDVNGSPTLGRYTGAVVALAVDLGSLDYVYSPLLASSNDAFFLNGQNVGGFPSDGYSADVFGAPASLGATAMDSGDFHFSIASSSDLWATDAIPAAQPLAQAGIFDRLNELQIEGTLGGDTFQINALITQIPEPGTGALLALGLAGIGVVRRRR